MYIGIDLGGTNIAAGLVSEEGKILASASMPTKRARHYSEIVRDMAAVSRKVAADAGCDISRVKAVGIGCPGTVDTKEGIVIYTNNIKMDHTPLAAEFRKHLDLPVVLENDANAAAFGEYAVTASGVDGFVMMTLGTGVGGGIVMNGKLWRGFNGASGEIGHIVIRGEGEPCTCGMRGCLESYASVTALIRQTERAMMECPSTLMHDWVRKHGAVKGKTAFECAAAGDPAAIEVRDRYIGYVAEGVNNMINIFQPEVFCLGGGISREGDVILTPVKEYVAKYNYNKYGPYTDIRIATLFNDAGIIGAAMAAMQELA